MRSLRRRGINGCFIQFKRLYIKLYLNIFVIKVKQLFKFHYLPSIIHHRD